MNRLAAFWRSTYFKFFVTYICIFVAPFLFFSAVIFFKANALAEDNTRNYYYNKLQEVKIKLDRTFLDISSIKQQIEYSKWFNDAYFSKIAEEKELDPYFLSQIIKELQHLQMYNPNIMNIAFRFDNDKDVFSSLENGVMPLFVLDPGNETPNIKTLPLSANSENSFDIIKRQLVYNNSKRDYLIYVQGISNLYSRNQYNKLKACLNVYINYDSLIKELNGLLGTDDGLQFAAVDPTSGDVMLSSNKTINALAEQKDFIVLNTNSDYTGLNYIMFTPKTIFNYKTNSMKNYFFILSLISLLICLVLSFIFSKKNYNPIKRLISKLNNNSTIVKRNELFYIDEMVSNLINDKNVLKEELTNNNQYVVQYLLKQLIKSDKVEPDLINKLNNCGVKLPYSFFCVIALELPMFLLNKLSIQEKNETILTIKNIIYSDLSNFNINKYILENESNNLLILANFNDSDINPAIEKINSDFNILSSASEVYVHLTMGVGCTVNSISGIYPSYKEAISALKYKIIEGTGSTIFFENIKGRPSVGFYYPILDEVNLLNSIKEGDFAKAGKLIDRIMNENIYKRNLNANNAKYIYYEIIATVVKAVGDLNLPPDEMLDYESIDSIDTLFDIHEHVKQIVFNLCSKVSEAKGSAQGNLFINLVKYVDDNCFQNNLSLNTISEKFNVSASFISKYFRDNLHVAFSDYVNKKRIEKAVGLMDDSDGEIALNEIYMKVGYDTTLTFRNNFKKYMGILPGEYQENLRKRSS